MGTAPVRIMAGAGSIGAPSGIEVGVGVSLGVDVAEGVVVAVGRGVGEGEGVRVGVAVGVGVAVAANAGEDVRVGVAVLVGGRVEVGPLVSLGTATELGVSRACAISGAMLTPQRLTRAAITRITTSVSPSNKRFSDRCMSFVSLSSRQSDQMRRIIPQKPVLVIASWRDGTSSTIIAPVYFGAHLEG